MSYDIQKFVVPYAGTRDYTNYAHILIVDISTLEEGPRERMMSNYNSSPAMEEVANGKAKGQIFNIKRIIDFLEAADSSDLSPDLRQLLDSAKVYVKPAPDRFYFAYYF